MRYKIGVSLAGARPELIIGLMVADSVYKEITGKEVLVTSLTEGEHMPGSLHPKGFAADLGIRSLTQEKLTAIFKMLAAELGREWDVVRETNHFHIEFQPN